MTITAAADGSALGNPGPAGWGWYVDADRWAAGGWPHGTNNQGELTAVLDLLRQTSHLAEDLVICCDSQYAINAITRWTAAWKRRGWRKADGKPVLNVAIIQALDAEMTKARAAGRRIEFRWVRGHAGHDLNEQADRLANGAAASYQAGRVPDPGPGMPGAQRNARDIRPNGDPLHTPEPGEAASDPAGNRTASYSAREDRETPAPPTLFD